LGIDASNYPRADGSTSALPIGRFVACKVLGAQFEWRHPESKDERTVVASDNLEGLANENYRGEKRDLCDYINRIVEHHGTHEAYSNLIKGRADLILVARQQSEDEQKMAEAARIEIDAAPIALDAFVFLLNTQNSVTNLSIEQIRDIYSGKVRNWKDVGGADARIVAYQRNRNAGSQETMKQLVMKDRPLITGPDVLESTLMSMTILRISEDPNGIAYSFFFYQELMASHAGVRPCLVNGVQPTAQTIRDRSYPLVTEVYAVTRKHADDTSPAKRLRNWLLTPEGQAAVGESEYVPLEHPSLSGLH
jgi:phosphate transport system substrate-binding protein